VPRPAPDKWSGLGLRVLTGAILAPLLLLAIYAGPPYSDAVLVAAGGAAAWEWVRLCQGQGGPWDRVAGLAAASVAASLLAAAAGLFDAALWLTAAGAMAVLLLAARKGRDGDAAWSALGVAYIAPAFLFFQWLLGQAEGGLWAAFWLVAVVWGTDIGAYFAGRAIGGPKLMPAVSPKKTWAGLAGGMIAAAGAGAGAAWLGDGNVLGLAAGSAALAVVAQSGDLFESSLKRRHGAKDSGNLIPGHGGVLDRIDGFLAVSLVYGGFLIITGASV
jgi:phosphatidate cytidylyltransferase